MLAQTSPSTTKDDPVKAAPKVLLLTDIPPCRDLTAGIVLHQLCSFLPRESLTCFSVINPAVGAQLDSEFAGIPYETVTKPAERNRANGSGPLAEAESFIRETYNSIVTVKTIASQAAEFGRKNQVDKVWCVLQGQTMIRLGILVAEQLNKPLLTQVWDPPEWWLRANSVDQRSTGSILRLFENTLRRSQACAAASWAMAEEYQSQYGCNAIPVVPGLDESQALAPATRLHERDTLTIGFAGQLYATDEWYQLMNALHSVNWNIGGKQVVVRVLGRGLAAYANTAQRIEFWGWHDQKDTIKVLADTDILYCPYWFDPKYEKETRQSFPSKLTTYLAAGRPVLCHAPEYASPLRFLARYEAGVLCKTGAADELLSGLRRLVETPEYYATIARNGRLAFDEHLTHRSMRGQFYRFLGIH